MFFKLHWIPADVTLTWNLANRADAVLVSDSAQSERLISIGCFDKFPYPKDQILSLGCIARLGESRPAGH